PFTRSILYEPLFTFLRFCPPVLRQLFPVQMEVDRRIALPRFTRLWKLRTQTAPTWVRLEPGRKLSKSFRV
ncbi:MAG: hypothetical protein V9H26_10860, partial [Verrucomicrobiota bacterium]